MRRAFQGIAIFGALAAAFIFVMGVYQFSTGHILWGFIDLLLTLFNVFNAARCWSDADDAV